MKIKKMNWLVRALTFGWATAMCITPFGIYYKTYYNERIINHEKIHWAQQMEMLIIPFYFWYFIEWFVKLFWYGKRANLAISFEREAYNNDDNLSYLKTRKHFAWIKYIKK